MRREGEGSMGRWGDGEIGRISISLFSLLPSSFFLLPSSYWLIRGPAILGCSGGSRSGIGSSGCRRNRRNALICPQVARLPRSGERGLKLIGIELLLPWSRERRLKLIGIELLLPRSQRRRQRLTGIADRRCHRNARIGNRGIRQRGGSRTRKSC